VVRHANRQHALAQIESSLRAGAQVFEKLIEQRNLQITPLQRFFRVITPFRKLLPARTRIARPRYRHWKVFRAG